jgi:hypothetical protein
MHLHQFATRAVAKFDAMYLDKFSFGKKHFNVMSMANEQRMQAFDKATGLNSVRVVNPAVSEAAKQKDEEV